MERIIVTEEIFDEFERMLDEEPKDLPRLRKLFNKKSPWEETKMTNEEHEAGKIRDEKIKKMRAGGMKLAAIAEGFGLSTTRISQICPPPIVKEAVPMRYVTVYLSYELVDELKALAKKEKSSVSSIVKAAISDCLKKKK